MSQSYICIKSGDYRNKQVDGMMFPLVKQFQTGAKGGFVTVQNAGHFPNCPDEVRIKVKSPTAYTFVDKTAYVAAGYVAAEEIVPEAEQETDEQVMTRISGRFEILHEMAKAACNGDVRAMIVTGPPGVGKSFGIEAEVDRAVTFDKIAGRKLRAEVVKGSATAIGLYCTLFKYSDPGSVLVFDDCDSMFFDDTSLNILKGALDTGKKRKISWLADSSMLKREDVPSSFEFKGSIIFITNLDFDHIRSKALKDHLQALQSRCHYVDLTINTTREKVLRIRQIAATGELFSDYNFTERDSEEIVEFVAANHAHLREISLRTAIKVADLKKTFPTRWQEIAKTTCMKPVVA